MENLKITICFPIKRSYFSQRKCYLQGSMFGETKRNSEVRWNEHCSLKKGSEVGDHLVRNPDHNIT